MTKYNSKFFTLKPMAIIGLIILVVGITTPSILNQKSMAQFQQQNRGVSHQITTGVNFRATTTDLPSYFNSTFTHHLASVKGGVILHYVIGGHGDPVVLLHGWPETWYEWRHVMPALAKNYTVIVPDLPGLGDSSKPLTGYDGKTVADDIHQLVTQLGFKSIFLVGHDFGAQAAYPYAAAHPTEVKRLVVMDFGFLPGGLPLWWFSFHQTRDIPEALVEGKEMIYLSWFYQNLAYNQSAITPSDIGEYVRHYSGPGGMGAGFEYYRAFPEDLVQNMNYSKTKLPMPVLALGSSFTTFTGGNITTNYTLDGMKALAQNVRGIQVPNSGHFIPEERPNYVISQLSHFFSEGK